MVEAGQKWISGKTCMITGSNSGIGKATAVALAKMGASVVMVCRNQAKGEAARLEIIAQSGANAENVSLMVADLSSLDSVRVLANAFASSGRPLHVLVNNAGVILGKRIVTKDGFETTFEVNYLSHFLLTNLLTGLLRSNAPSRVVNVSSEAHSRGHIDFDDLQEERNFGALRSYSQSKIAQVLFTSELARRLEGTGVTTNAVHPGAVATNWGTHSVGLLSVGVRIAHPFMLSAGKGADTVVYLASSPDVSGMSGKYFTKRRAVTPSKEAMDASVAERLWKVSEELVALRDGPR